MTDKLESLFAISPVDGRYGDKLHDLRNVFSEYALIKARVTVQIKWFIILSQQNQIIDLPALSVESEAYLLKTIENFSLTQAQQIKEFEKITNHDLKACEYFLQAVFQQNKELKPYISFIHFACTSEDVNNLAYGLIMKDVLDKQILPHMGQLQTKLVQTAEEFAEIPMLAKTHGQPASPTTVGKEFANVVFRLESQIKTLSNLKILGKINGATGNFNAHLVAYPDFNWYQLSENFVKNLGLSWLPYTTQIEPHDYLADLSHNLIRFNNILIDFNRDVWSYISYGIFKQKALATETGSSTMPHKVNPIDFENSEGNLGVANSLLDFFANKLPMSRLQRDLTDSTVLRNFGSAFGHSILGFLATLKGLNKLEVNEAKLQAELESSWEVVAEAVQTVMRKNLITDAYEQLKEATRGKDITKEILHDFIKNTKLNERDKQALLALTPQTYIGNAVASAKNIKLAISVL